MQNATRSKIVAMPPLTNKRILITRTRHQASDLATQLEALGATTVTIPTIELVPPTSFAALDAALTCLRTYNWLIFTSANAVEAFHRRAQFLHFNSAPSKNRRHRPGYTQRRQRHRPHGRPCPPTSDS